MSTSAKLTVVTAISYALGAAVAVAAILLMTNLAANTLVMPMHQDALVDPVATLLVAGALLAALVLAGVAGRALRDELAAERAR